MRRFLLAEKLRSVARDAPKDAALATADAGGCPIPANRMLLALCSDYFEAMFRFRGDAGADETQVAVVDLSDVSAEDAGLVVAYSEGAYEPAVEDVGTLMRVQDRFLMPELRQRCDELLRDHITATTWRAVAATAAAYQMWDLLQHAVVWASRQQWPNPAAATEFARPLFAPDGPHWRCAPAACVSAVLRAADFVSVGHKFDVAVAWALAARARGDEHTDAAFDVLASELSSADAPRLWPGEVQRILEHEEILPRSVLVAVARAAWACGPSGPSGAGATPGRKMPHHAGCLTSELRKSMAKVDASIVATSGAGTYQMIISPSAVDVDGAYFSDEVRLGSPPSAAEYHVYLNEEEKLDRWWRTGSRPAMHVLVRFRRAS